MTLPLLVLVTARGGSKRLPGKNLALLAGKSLLAWTAEALRASTVGHSPCLLSTDDGAIRDEGLRFGWLVPWLRPAPLATDSATSLDVALHALEWWRNTHGADPARLLLLQPTTPFRDPAMLDRAVATLDTADAVIGASVLHRSLRTLFSRGTDGFLSPLGCDDEPKPILTPNGALYAIRPEVLRSQRTFFPVRTVAIEMGPIHSIDIDTPEDWRIAAALAAEVR